MKIATWNIERPSANSKRVPFILNELRRIKADIFILTESNECIIPNSSYHIKNSSPFVEFQPQKGEVRVSILSRYSIISEEETFQSDKSACIVLDTTIGKLAVYGTIIGITGNRAPDFQKDLDMIIKDIDHISKLYPLCIAGDFNMSFSDIYYFTKEGKEKLNACFERNNLINMTAGVKNNIDHIVLPQNLASLQNGQPKVWNNVNKLEKKDCLSDHQGVCVEINYSL
ncbi:MAG: endonuclease/exonuclease/phosphatase family protein [bacterium]